MTGAYTFGRDYYRITAAPLADVAQQLMAHGAYLLVGSAEDLLDPFVLNLPGTADSLPRDDTETVLLLSYRRPVGQIAAAFDFVSALSAAGCNPSQIVSEDGVRGVDLGVLRDHDSGAVLLGGVAVVTGQHEHGWRRLAHLLSIDIGRATFEAS